MRARTLVLPLALAALLLPAAAPARVRLSGLDTNAYPTIRATVLTSSPSSQAPVVRENGNDVVGLQTQNLGSQKSVVLAVDRSRSMAGAKLVNAAVAARQFVADKPPGDRIALLAFGVKPLPLSRFSTATIDADNALRSLAIDSNSGTALYDAVVTSSRLLSAEGDRGRVLILLTDGTDVSSSASLDEAAQAAKKAGVIIYSIAVGADASTKPLRRLSSDTGGTFYGASSPQALRGIYGAIARELRRTWRVEYVTAARPGDALRLTASVSGLGSGAEQTTIPAGLDSGAVATTKPTSLLPTPFYGPIGDLLFTFLSALLVLGAGIFVMQSVRSSWLKNRLAPHVEPAATAAKRKSEGERLAFLNGLFSATERAFGHRSQWRRLELMLERADVPLRTVEFAWLIAGCSFAFGIFAALSRQTTLVILTAFGIGAALPYLWVWFKARRRMRAFEDQLPDLLITMAASLKAGHSFKQGIQSVVDEGQEPAAKELKRVLTDTRLGRPMDEALQDTADRIGSKNFSFVITAVTIQRQVGGSLAGLFDMVADTVRQRQQFARKIRGLTAMGRASAYVLVGLPFFVAFAITLLNSSYMAPLYNSSTGHMLIFIGLGMMAFGSLVLKKIVSFKG